MSWLSYLIATLFTLVGGLCLITILFSLPGGWLVVVLAAIINLVDQTWHDPALQTFDWRLIGACVLLLILGEIIEFAAGAAGAKAGGASRRGMIGALIGGIAGGILGTFFPVPVVGSLIGALVGTFVGAIWAEITGASGHTLTTSLKPATGATIGRILGTVGKIAISVAVWISLSIAAFWP